MNYSKRLEMIISMVPPCRQAADIGTDHGFLPVALVSRGRALSAVASDIRKGPLSRAMAHVREAGLVREIDCRLGPGLTTLAPGEADVIVIAGMGGILMRQILLDDRDTACSASSLVLSPHTDPDLVRKTVTELGFGIEDEEMTEEEGKFYTVMRCVPRKGPADTEEKPLSEEELRYGPVLLKKRPDAFLQFLRAEEVRLERIRTKLQEASGEAKDAGIEKVGSQIGQIRRILEWTE